MFRFTRKPSSGSHNQYLAKNTGLVQCRYRRRTDDVSIMAAYYDMCGLCVVLCASVYCAPYTVHNTHTIICSHNTNNVCKTSVSTLHQACIIS